MKVVGIILVFLSLVVSQKLNGVCYTSWTTKGSASYDSDESDASIKLSTKSGINMLALVVTYYQDNQNSTTISFSNQKSNSDASIKRAISVAKASGLKVALKPHVDFLHDDAHWRGEIGPAFTPAQWNTWFASYKSYITHMATLAQQNDVDLFVIGTELITTEKNEALWRDVIKACRAITGNIPYVYGANWSPGPANVPFWDVLDIIGVDAYYPLATNANSTVSELVSGWSASPHSGNIVSDLHALSTKYDKNVMFAEIGYTTTDACAVGNHAGGALNMQAQANAYEAFFEAVYSQPWFHGVFFWNWDTNPHQGGRCDSDFTPARKLAEGVMQKHFGSLFYTASASPEFVDPYVVYTNGALTSGWQDYSYNGKTNLKATDHVAPGSQMSAHGQYTNWGAMSFHYSSALSMSPYANLSFSVLSSPLSQSQIQVGLYGSTDPNDPFPEQFIAHYVPSCHLSNTTWIIIQVPLADLISSPTTEVTRMEFKGNYATGVGEFWLDNVQLE